MTADQYRAALEQLGLTQAQAGQLLGVSVRSAHSYANGAQIPETVARLLSLMLQQGLRPENVPWDEWKIAQAINDLAKLRETEKEV